MTAEARPQGWIKSPYVLDIEREFGRPIESQMIDLIYRKGWSLARIAERWGVAPRTAWRYVNAAGLNQKAVAHAAIRRVR